MHKKDLSKSITKAQNKIASTQVHQYNESKYMFIAAFGEVE